MGEATNNSRVLNAQDLITVPEFSNFAVVVTLAPIVVLAMLWVRKRRAVAMKHQEKLLEVDKLQRK